MWDSSVIISSLKFMMSSSGPLHAMLKYHMALLGCSNTICNDLGNVGLICDIILKGLVKLQLVLPIINYKAQSHIVKT
jgi:hypothetical protein